MFEGLPQFTAPFDYYNGGFATDAVDPGTIVAGPGPDYGISFRFANTPTDDQGLDDDEVIMSTASIPIRMLVEGGFTGSLELDYLVPDGPGGNAIQIFDGPNLTGNIIATFNTSPTVGQTYAHASIPFSGTALSVRLMPGAFYDNIQVVPEPATAALLALGLAALAARRRAS